MVSDQDFPGIISYSPYSESRGVQSNQEYRNIWWFYHNIEWTELGKNIKKTNIKNDVCL